MYKYVFLAVLIVLTSCISVNNKKKLPILGPRDTHFSTQNNQQIVDTIYHTIPTFSFINQDSNIVTNTTVAGKIYIADFFFTSCPTICPIMTSNLVKVRQQFKNENNLVILSHSIDTRHDSVPVLKKYAEKIGAKAPSWHFLTGNKHEIYTIAESYLVSAAEDGSAPGGYIHSGAFILIDSKGRIRGYYDGTLERDIDFLIKDLKVLLHEEQNS